MSHEFRLADIGEGLDQAEIVEWRVAIGDRVERDQPIVEVMTDKSNAELPAPVAGVIVELGGAAGDIISVGALVAVIDAAGGQAAPPESGAEPGAFQLATGFGEPADQAGPAEPSSASSTVPPATPAQIPPAVAPSGSASLGRPKASPATRLAAAQAGIDLSTVSGTGPGGRILLSDIQAPSAEPAPPPVASVPAPESGPQSAPVSALDQADPPAAGALEAPPAAPQGPGPKPAPVRAVSAPSPSAAPDPVVALRGIRRVIATNMAQSWSEIPHIHATQHIDAEPALALREQLRSSGRAEFGTLTPLSLFVAAVASAMSRYRQANATLDLAAQTITNHPDINIGIAVASPRGLVVPVLREANRLGLAEIAAEVRRLVDGARGGSLDAAEFRGGTATITNFGALGSEQAMPIIRPPESVIFGFGSIAARPFVIDDQVVARDTMHIVIGADHRLLDGDVVTAMLNHVANLLTTPINFVLGR